jgi:hypothetical protein
MEECGQCPVFECFTLAFALQLRKKHGKSSVSVAIHKQVKSVIVTTQYLRRRKVSIFSCAACFDLPVYHLQAHIDYKPIKEDNIKHEIIAIHNNCTSQVT